MKAALLLLAVTPLAAASLDQRVSKLEQQMKETRMHSVYGNTGANTASATPSIHRYGPFLSVDMLYWKPFIGGTEFAYIDNEFPVAAPFYGNVVQFNFDWQFGFRTALGYQFTNPDWDISGIFTRVKFHQTKHENKPLSASGLPDVTDETSAEGKWSTSFNVLDLDLARAYFLRPRFSIHPRIGVRTAWIKQHDHMEYSNASNNRSNLLVFNNSTSGVGLLAGSGLHWHWSSQWSLFGNFIASLIYGKIEVGAKSVNFFPTLAMYALPRPSDPLNVSADTYKVLPNTSLDIGLQWEMSWSAVRLSMAAGYEFQYWWRQNQQLQLDNGTTYSWQRHSEDLGFQGIKFNAGLDF